MGLFLKRKEDVLSKLDKSNKGSIDTRIKKICEIINSKEDYFTTSSCSGRIVVIKVGKNRKKDSEWLFTSHELVEDCDELLKILQGYSIPLSTKVPSGQAFIAKANSGKEGTDDYPCNDVDIGENIWFKQEPMILHVCCKDINAANKLWKMAHSVGYKRGGIRKGRHWYNVEIMGSEFIEAPLKRVSKEYIRILVKEGNKRMKRSFSRMKKFERKLTN